jgi:hypothetical protein
VISWGNPELFVTRSRNIEIIFIVEESKRPFWIALHFYCHPKRVGQFVLHRARRQAEKRKIVGCEAERAMLCQNEREWTALRKRREKRGERDKVSRVGHPPVRAGRGSG